jgi:hypothetical protein
MKLILLEVSGTIKNGEPCNGEIYSYDVSGLPAGQHAKIAYFDNAWRILRWNDEWHGNWTGSYPTADAALDRLRNELIAVTQN